MTIDVARLSAARPPQGMPFRIEKIGHVVLQVSDVDRSVDFYTRAMGFQVSDVYPETMMPGGMVFFRCNPDHHCLAIIGLGKDANRNIELHHVAFQVASLDEVFRARNHLQAYGAQIDFDGRRRAGCQIAVEFRDPDNHRLEIYWGLDLVGAPGTARPAAEWRGAKSLEEAVDNPVPGQDTTLFDPTLRRG
jgi:catechol 2,3-dioxygenase-like lactoylglutathione lyase family enzyme